MQVAEIKSPKQEENSPINNESEFKELDNEIEKVVRGETSYEEEQLGKNSPYSNNSQTTFQEDNKFKTNLSINRSNCNTLANSFEEQGLDFKNMSNNKLFNQNGLNSLNRMEKYATNSPINFDKAFFSSNNNYINNKSNNLNLNNQNIVSKNNKTQNKKHKSKKNQNINSFNNNINNINNINSCIYSSNNNNNRLNELILSNLNNSNNIYLNELIANNANNYNNILNDIKILNCINNINKNNNNFDMLNNLNINNNEFLQNLINCLYSNKSPNLNKDLYNNTIIANQIITPLNINLQLTNITNDNMTNNNCKFFNNINGLYNVPFNGLKNNINTNLSHYMQINNNHEKSGIYLCNDPNINNNNINQMIMLNNSVRQFNNNNNTIMDLLVNNIINNNQALNNFNNTGININNNLNNSIKNNNTNNNNNNNNENSINKGYSNNFTKRKIFNPLSDLEKEKNIINLMDIFQCKDLRTTLMIKNIPNKYTISSFLEEINENFKNTYDIFYLPIDYVNKCNLGFAFINFVEPFHIILFYELYRGKKWKKFNSEKKCELLYAKYQGRKELIAHFEKGKVLTFDREEKRPLILPEPCQYPRIKIPCYYLDLFIKLHPRTPYKIKNINNNKNNNNNSISKIFTINGNFHKTANELI